MPLMINAYDYFVKFCVTFPHGSYNTIRLLLDVFHNSSLNKRLFFSRIQHTENENMHVCSRYEKTNAVVCYPTYTQFSHFSFGVMHAYIKFKDCFLHSRMYVI